MDGTIRNLLLAGVFFLAVSIDSWTLGSDYDERHGLYPEPDYYSCTMGEVYGQRWVRLGAAAFWLAAVFSFSAGIVLYRRSQLPTKSIVDYIREE